MDHAHLQARNRAIAFESVALCPQAGSIASLKGQKIWPDGSVRGFDICQEVYVYSMFATYPGYWMLFSTSIIYRNVSEFVKGFVTKWVSREILKIVDKRSKIAVSNHRRSFEA
jgi:hypothetical protein